MNPSKSIEYRRGSESLLKKPLLQSLTDSESRHGQPAEKSRGQTTAPGKAAEKNIRRKKKICGYFRFPSYVLSETNKYILFTLNIKNKGGSNHAI